MLAGESKGSTGRIVRVIPKMNRVVVEGVNMIKKHQKPSAASPQVVLLKWKLQFTFQMLRW